jgi:hypothetical protein
MLQLVCNLQSTPRSRYACHFIILRDMIFLRLSVATQPRLLNKFIPCDADVAREDP